MLSIITPTYNRSSLLSSLYTSLCSQTSKDFEWIIVDDGSTDGTDKLISRFAGINVSYYKKGNGGKHTAVNLGVGKAKGELTLILDSDDELPKTAVEDILSEWDATNNITIKGKPLGGLCGYMAHRDGRAIGHPMISTCCDETELRYKYDVNGDMCEVFRTNVLREFPFPEIKGEKFCPEALVWNRIAQKYSLKVFPRVVYYRDYLKDGLTSNIVKIRMQSPIATCMTYAEMLDYAIPAKSKVKAAINYWRFKACSSKKVPRISTIWSIAKPLGLLMHVKDEISLSFVGH